MNVDHLLNLFLKFLSFSLLLQSAELYAPAWQAVSLPFSGATLTRARTWQGLLGLRIGLAFLGLFFPHPLIFLYLLGTQVLINLRFQGAINGGSDSTTLWSLLVATILGFLGPGHALSHGLLYFLTLQVALSYFLAGFWHFQSAPWRSGQTLSAILKSPRLLVPPKLSELGEFPKICQLISYLVMGWELLFPLAFLHFGLLLLFLFLGLFFHIGNFLLFGLNRFFWSWLATYPVVIWAVLHMRHALP